MVGCTLVAAAVSACKVEPRQVVRTPSGGSDALRMW